ncbi:MAG TPA: ATP-binding protein [Gammaproteobacteria bacterium]|nr:ATP-binding protein [Gammaproteobacteria bacterium]
MRRIQTTAILNDLDKKMVLLVGPRQAGKTWLAKQIAQSFSSSIYLNYDQLNDRPIILQQNWLAGTELVILDELHKMPEWKNYLKGLYDTKPAATRLLVTGSARLDIFNHVGDSLAGRYFRHRLLPLSPAELYQTGMPVDLEKLLKRSGFPEPYLADNDIDAERWRLQYMSSLLNTDIFEFDSIQHIKAMQLIFNLLRQRVGSPVSYQSLAEDIGISPTTVKKYIQILEAVYIVFRITPYSNNISRSLIKEPKIYFFDTALVEGNEGVKLENLVANCLLKHVYAKYDYEAAEYELHYLRTKDGEEVDFAISNKGVIEKIIEVKAGNQKLSTALIKFHKKYAYPAVQIVKNLRHELVQNGIEIIRAENFLRSLLL